MLKFYYHAVGLDSSVETAIKAIREETLFLEQLRIFSWLSLN